MQKAKSATFFMKWLKRMNGERLVHMQVISSLSCREPHSCFCNRMWKGEKSASLQLLRFSSSLTENWNQNVASVWNCFARGKEIKCISCPSRGVSSTVFLLFQIGSSDLRHTQLMSHYKRLKVETTTPALSCEAPKSLQFTEVGMMCQGTVAFSYWNISGFCGVGTWACR